MTVDGSPPVVVIQPLHGRRSEVDIDHGPPSASARLPVSFLNHWPLLEGRGGRQCGDWQLGSVLRGWPPRATMGNLSAGQAGHQRTKEPPRNDPDPDPRWPARRPPSLSHWSRRRGRARKGRPSRKKWLGQRRVGTLSLSIVPVRQSPIETRANGARPPFIISSTPHPAAPLGRMGRAKFGPLARPT